MIGKKGDSMEPEDILAEARRRIEEHANGDPDKWWYANRYVFARLMLDERKTKTAIKQRLFDDGQPCHFCGEPFEKKKGIHLHRLDPSCGYSDANCVLMHGDCHEKQHKQAPGKIAKAAGQPAAQPDARGILTKRSKRYEGAFSYWWDITPALAETLNRYEAIEFVCGDTKASCVVPVSALMPMLTPERQTTRGAGNWEVKVRTDHEDELAFGPGKSKGEWQYVSVTWMDEGEDD